MSTEPTRVQIIQADTRQLPLADNSVDLIVTSPPYFGLRSYTDGGEHYDGQIGAEPTPAAYVAALIDATREWLRVLKPEGNLWVNLGDSYYSGKGAPGKTTVDAKNAGRTARRERRSPLDYGLPYPRKTLLGIPWRYALACIDELGLILRAEVIWSKPNGLPESVTDRVRRSHEQWFHFVQQPRYYSAVDSIREAHTAPDRKPGAQSMSGRNVNLPRTSTGAYNGPNPLGKLPGSVWEVATQPLTVPATLGVGHFAAFPIEWPLRLITGWSPPGICTACGAGRRPVPADPQLDMTRPQARRAHALAERAGLTEDHLAALLSVGISDTGRGAATQTGTGHNTPEVYALADEARAVLGGYAREYLLRRPTSIRHVCDCETPTAPTTPAVVLDPFGGTGTTALAADVLGRTGISVDASADYCRIAAWRTTDPGERARAMGVRKPEPELEGQLSLLDALEAAA
jgi:DNA modification methylase